MLNSKHLCTSVLLVLAIAVFDHLCTWIFSLCDLLRRLQVDEQKLYLCYTFKGGQVILLTMVITVNLRISLLGAYLLVIF